MKVLISLFILSMSLSCVDVPKQFDSLPPGEWRAVLKLYDHSIVPEELKDNKQNTPYRELPFNFKIEYDESNQVKLHLINGEELLDIAEIEIGLDRSTAKDTVVIDFPIFNSTIRAIYEEGILEGHWHVNFKEGYQIPFYAQHGQVHRFTNLKDEDAIDFSGRWKTTFEFDNEEDAYPAIGEFAQSGNKVTGSFMTETGDYRYLEGNVIGKKLHLSTFDGAHAFLFEAIINENEELVGIFKSGKHYTSNWIAERNETFELQSASELTKAIDPLSPVDFEFPNYKGDIVKLSDEVYNEKNKIINIMGTWCPNCFDEIEFLKAFKKTEAGKDFEIISIAFERFKEEAKSLEAIEKYRNKMDVSWDMLYGGIANKKENVKQLPFIDQLISYPTMIILDKSNKIKYIHTGFSGPATSEYGNFKTKFDQVVKDL